ncbi:MAG: hypothetical protein FJ144_21715 [Deltaproteobacteria bacterium]|nr:hypothetical protein [Deltaproteobacteria bacterium]
MAEEAAEAASSQSRLAWSAAAVATALCAACVLHGIGDKSLWLDEGHNVLWAKLPWDRFVHVVTTREANMVLYSLLLRGWLPFADGSDAWIRAPSAFGVIATVPFLFALGRGTIGTRAALASAFLFATHPLVVRYGQEARSYGLLLLAVTVATLALVRAVEGGRTRDWIAWSVSLAAAVYLHFFAAFVALAHALAVLSRGRSGVPWRPALTAGAATILLVLPLVAFLLAHEDNSASWVPLLSSDEILDFLLQFSGSAGGFGLAAAAIAWALGAIALAAHAPRWIAVLLVSWAFLPAVLTALISLREPFFVPRYLLVSLPALAMLAGASVASLPRALGGTLLVCLLVANGRGLDRWWNHTVKDNWRESVAWIADAAEPGDVLTCWPAVACGPVSVYFERLPEDSRPRFEAITLDPTFALPSPLVPSRIEAVAREERIWLVSRPVGARKAHARAGLEVVEKRLAATHARERIWSGHGVETALWVRRKSRDDHSDA